MELTLESSARLFPRLSPIGGAGAVSLLWITFLFAVRHQSYPQWLGGEEDLSRNRGSDPLRASACVPRGTEMASAMRSSTETGIMRRYVPRGTFFTVGRGPHSIVLERVRSVDRGSDPWIKGPIHGSRVRSMDRGSDPWIKGPIDRTDVSKGKCGGDFCRTFREAECSTWNIRVFPH